MLLCWWQPFLSMMLLILHQLDLPVLSSTSPQKLLADCYQMA
uniref:Uncharacterized protein n=1 Tax=Arundo donax TaxID=35708 RepID=A0A0A9DBD4_ARUDO